MAATFAMGTARLAVTDGAGARREVKAPLWFNTWTGHLMVHFDAFGMDDYPQQIDLHGSEGGVERFTRTHGGRAQAYALYEGGASTLAVVGV